MNFRRSIKIWPIIKEQFQITNQIPRDIFGNFKFIMLATEDTGEIPRFPCLVIATPSAEKKRPIIKMINRFKVSLLIIAPPENKDYFAVQPPSTKRV